MDKKLINIDVLTHIEPRILSVNENGRFSGLAIEMLDNLGFNSEYKFNITKPEVHKDLETFGADGDFFTSQVEKCILSGEVQLAGSSYYFVASRAQHIDILLPTIADKMSAYFIQPHPIESNSLLTGPFTFQTLLLQLLMSIIFVLSGSIILWISSGNLSLKNAFLEATWGVISAFNLQGCSIFEATFSLRVLFITVSTFFILMHSMYSAFFLSTLTSEINPIRSFSQLLSREYTMFASASLTDYVKKENKAAKVFKNGLESFKEAYRGGHVHVDHGHSDVLEFYMLELNNDGPEIKRKLSNVPFPSSLRSGFYISKNWTRRLREPLNRRITQLGDTGFMHRYRVNYFRNSESAYAGGGNGFFELELVHVAKLFILWAGFSVSAIILLMIELFHYKKLGALANITYTITCDLTYTTRKILKLEYISRSRSFDGGALTAVTALIVSKGFRMQIRFITHSSDGLIELNDAGEFTGVKVQLLQEMQYNLSINFNIIRTLNFKNTSLDESTDDYFITDIEAPLTSGEIDLAGSNYYFLPNRAKNLIMLHPIAVERISAYFMQPNPMESYNWITSAYSLETVTVYLSTVVVLTLSNILFFWTLGSKSQTTLFQAACDGVWGILSIMHLKNFPGMMSSTPSKILFVTAWILFQIWNSVSCAFLISTFTSSVDPIHTFEDIVKHKYSINANPALRDIFVIDAGHSSIGFSSGLESYSAIYSGKHAQIEHVMSQSVYDKELNALPDEMCTKISAIPFPSRVTSGMYLSRNISLMVKEILNNRIARLAEVGLLSRYSVEYFRGTVHTCLRRPQSYFEIEWMHIRKLVYFWISISSVALFMLGLELRDRANNLFCCRV